MKLFHYHHWTDRVEETEQFYSSNGFRTAGRFGMEKTYHPPLTWDDFRDDHPYLRIVEMRKGKVNITFGQGKRPMFDHIGWLVSKSEHDEICLRAQKLGWNVNSNERRTFIGTPFRLRLELQQNNDAVDEGQCELRRIDIAVKNLNGLEKLTELFGRLLPELRFQESEELSLVKATILDTKTSKSTDPNGVFVQFVEECHD